MPALGVVHASEIERDRDAARARSHVDELDDVDETARQGVATPEDSVARQRTEAQDVELREPASREWDSGTGFPGERVIVRRADLTRRQDVVRPLAWNRELGLMLEEHHLEHPNAARAARR